MPFNFQAAVKKQYSVLPVPRDFIPSTKTPKPQILWVGCSDSLISETETLDVLSEELFVHRNLGNILSNHDLSSESAIEWAVGLLKVDHIIVCGHYDCGLIKEPADPHALHGWYKDVSKLHTLNDSYYANLSPSERDHHFEEVYVLAEVEYLKKQPVVQAAIAERGLKVHAFVYERSEARCVRLVEGNVVQEKIGGGQGSVEVVSEKVGFGGVDGGRRGVFEVEVR